jgi:FixJ family two-component response regulator
LTKVATISIIDDDAAVCKAIQSLLRSLGYRVAAFSSAEDFLASEYLHDTACLITDLHMPGLNGLELQEQLIAGGFRMPLIFITAHPTEAARTQAINAGAISLIGKPFSDASLIGCLDKALKAA